MHPYCDELLWQLAMQKYFNGHVPSRLVFDLIPDGGEFDAKARAQAEIMVHGYGTKDDHFAAERAEIIMENGHPYGVLHNSRYLSPALPWYPLVHASHGDIHADLRDRDAFYKRVAILDRWGSLDKVPNYLYYCMGAEMPSASIWPGVIARACAKFRAKEARIYRGDVGGSASDNWSLVVHHAEKLETEFEGYKLSGASDGGSYQRFLTFDS